MFCMGEGGSYHIGVIPHLGYQTVVEERCAIVSVQILLDSIEGCRFVHLHLDFDVHGDLGEKIDNRAVVSPRSRTEESALFSASKKDVLPNTSDRFIRFIQHSFLFFCTQKLRGTK